MKVIVFAVEVLFQSPMGLIGDAMLFWLNGYPKVELVFVMVIAPVFLNSLMFWVTDSFLKSDKSKEAEVVTSYVEI